MNAADHFDQLDSHVKEISIALRKIVLVLSPVLKEELKWNVEYKVNKAHFLKIAHI